MGCGRVDRPEPADLRQRLVDKCGTVFEGRAGGVDRPVHGAHTYGFNTDTTGIAVLGTYTAADDPDVPGVAPTREALDGVAKIAAWKLGLTGVDPTAKTTLTSAAPDGTGGKYPYGQQVEFDTISGHRDGFATACPGEQLYSALPAIRTAAKQITVPALTATVTGAAAAGGRYYTKSTASVNWTPEEGATYHVSVDGATAATGAASATVTLTPGTHSVQLHAAFADGTTSASPVFTVIADTIRPVISSQALSLRRSTRQQRRVARLAHLESDRQHPSQLAEGHHAVRQDVRDDHHAVGRGRQAVHDPVVDAERRGRRGQRHHRRHQPLHRRPQ
ncbi:N-acetylmuramoyl-L-alanine amidase [Spirillospora sp. CA-128828]|uniref:N-acetylmuramoyl-L-alanine amidase n=1 Tax=Spirillospora sp. CA-128828 TaxID=3240033 RepID=UPI003D8ABBF9